MHITYIDNRWAVGYARPTAHERTDMKTFGLEVQPGYVVARGNKTFGPVHPTREAAERYLRELAWELQREQQAKDE